MSKTPDFVTLKADLKAHVAIAAAFIVQAMGSAILADIHKEMLEKLYIKCHQGTLKGALKALQKRDIVSVESHWNEEAGRRLEYYAMKKLKFIQLEAAHWKELLPRLVEDNLGKEILSAFNENEGGTSKKGVKDHKSIDGQLTVTARFLLLEPIFGGALLSQALKKDIEDSGISVPGSEFERKAAELARSNSQGKRDNPRDEELAAVHEDILYFRRDPLAKKIIISSAACRGFMSGVFLLGKKSFSWADRLGYGGATVTPEQGLFLDDLPIQRRDQRGQLGGAGVKSHEVVRPGEIVEMTFTMPSENFIDPEWLRVYTADYAKHPRRSLSPARGTQYGRMLLVGWEVHGERMSAEASLSEVPDEVMAKYGDFLRQTEKMAAGLDGKMKEAEPSREKTARKVKKAVDKSNGVGDPADQPTT